MAVWNGDAQTCSLELSRLLLRTISYYDYKEDYYHAFLAGIFAGAGYEVESNREYGEGRSDVIVKDHAGDRAAVFEIKHASARSGLREGCEAALVQLEERHYAAQLEEDFSKVYGYGVAFYKKRCLVLERKDSAKGVSPTGLLAE